MSTPLRHDLKKLAAAVPGLRPLLVPMLRQARVSEEMIRIEFIHPGGVNDGLPARDDWAVLEVGGNTFPIKDELKRHGLRWDSGTKTWKIGPVQWYQQRLWARLMPMMQKAYKSLKPIIDQKNAEIAQRNDDQRGGPADMKGRITQLRQSLRMTERLKQHGIEVTFNFPRYGVQEPEVIVAGNTYDVRDLLKKYGFRWNSQTKNWRLPEPDWRLIGNKWTAEVIRRLGGAGHAQPDTSVGVFTSMSDRDLTTFLRPVVDHDYMQNEGYDGEKSWGEVMAEYKLLLKRWPAKKQQEFYDKWKNVRV